MRSLAIVAILIAGCVRSNAVECSFGLCPAASKCDETNHACIPGTCGNGKLDGDEQCDCGAANGVGSGFDTAACASTGARNCSDFGYYFDKGLACTPECTFDTRACTGSCGNEQLDGPEQCDGLPPPGEVCSDFGFDYGRMGCTALCGPDFSSCGTIGWRVELGMAPDALSALWGVPGDLFAVGGSGSILHSDGGVWTAMTSGTTQLLDGVWGSARDDVYAVGSNPSFVAGDGGLILHFDGTAWSPVPNLPTNHNLRAVWGRSKTDIYAVGDAGTVLQFNGTTWIQLAPPSATAQLLGVWGTDTDLFVVGTTGTAPVAYKLAGGWQPITVQTPVTATELTAVWGHGTSVFATGNVGTVIAAGVADTTWTPAVNAPAIANDLTSVWGTSDTDVYFVGTRGFIMHFDGKRYEQLLTDAGRSIGAVFGLSPRDVHVATKSGTVLAFAGTSWTEIQQIADPTQRLRSITADASGHMVAVGMAGIVVDSDPTSPTGWAPETTILASGTQPNINSVWASSDGTVYFAATGATGGLFHRDAGSTTIVQDIGPTGTFQAVAGASKTNVWAVGANGTGTVIRNWNGTSWVLNANVPAGTPKLTSVWVSASGEVFAAAIGGSVIHSSDNGATWTTMTTGLQPTDPIGSVQLGGPAANDLYLVGTGGSMAHYNGTTWRKLHLPTFAQLASFAVISPSDIYAFGSGAMIHYDGTTWVGILQPSTFASTAGVVVGNDLVMVGDLGQSVSLFDPPSTEQHCSDGFDDDRNGTTDCADPACAGNPACASGGSCTKVLAKLSCETTALSTSSYSGFSRIDDVPCLDHSSPGPEIAWEFAPEGFTGDVTVSITPASATPQLDLVAMPAYATGGCALPRCTAATAGAVTFHYDGTTPYTVLVDTDEAGHGADFTLTVSCP